MTLLQVRANIFKSNQYFKFLFKLSFKKKAIYVFIALSFVATTMLALITRFYATEKNFSLFSFIVLFINLSLTIIISSYMFLSIFKDLSILSVDIISFIKPYSRQYFILTKLLFLVVFGIFWSFFISFLLVSFYIINSRYFDQVNSPLIWGFLSAFFSFLIFGALTALVSHKFSSKLSLSIAIFSFSPFILIGSSSAFSSTSTINRFAEILNLEHNGYDSNTILDVEKFYLNNKKDQFFIIPKQVGNPNFSKRQVEYIQKAWNDSSAAAQVWQAASYLLIPYQLINVFEPKDRDAIENAVGVKETFLKNYIYSNNLASKKNNYFLSTNPAMKKYKLSSGQQVFLVPGALKNDSHFENLENREIIYANEDATNFAKILPQDSQTFGLTSDLVGKLRWNLIKELLSSPVFDEYAAKFFESFKAKTTQKEILEEISKRISTDKELLELNDEKTAVLAKKLDIKKVENQVQKKIYFASALIYWLYFNRPNSEILDSFLINEKQNFDPGPIFVKIDQQKYQIGGFSSFSAEQRVVENKVIKRFNLSKSDNFLFQPVLQMMEIKVNYQVVSKKIYPIIWVVISAVFFYCIFRIYSRKDYK
ncbi:ABC transporter permease [Mycoplasma flocculare]|nr:ABC transporter permease [Mesomycoplasma flocculare]MXR12175.1 ABC transporter permease [Mesomycoplasma flocculare]MXR22771.1 ABC transporter permease [Mesomycoplasma flocculare]MXR39391.1 ABC transporter permease [Mycoplasma sp. MF12]MXR55896.1 ABC transporter permease [Mesomycoplasma flocculare]